MTPRIVAGGRDSREHVFEFEKLPRQRYPSDLTNLAWPRLRTCSSDPNPRAGGRAPHGVGASRSTRPCTSTAPAAPGGCCPTTSPSPGWRQALPALGPRRHLGPRPRPAAPWGPPWPTAATPEPSAGVIDSCSINVSPVRGPGGFDGAKKIDGIKRYVVVDTLGLLVAVLVTAASVQDRAAVPRLLGRARYRCPGARPSVGRPGLHRQRRPGREQDPAVHDPDRGRDQAQGRLYHPASSLGRRAVFRPGCTAADASPASTRRPHWPMRPWSSSASTRSCSAASTE
jgi:hypothetical protein